jgi:hypothetical protein
LAQHHFAAAQALAAGHVFDPTPEFVEFNMDYADCLANLGEIDAALLLADRANAAAPQAFAADDPRRSRALRLLSGLHERCTSKQR